MIEWINSIVQFLFLVWMLGVAPVCIGIVLGHVLPDMIDHYLQWRARRKAKAADAADSPESPDLPRTS